eukprot:TRINITY_DN530_c0_g2_i1.p1 TRINITY_DN530_c0_g2~~TRINITY_DN530_c0_g2_i1.p1  ORF type:complete len:423 (-),score=103.91 TRINITY_DN530_c0_g2_i1:1022-2290(-)
MSKKNNLATRKRQHEFDLKITSWTPPFLRTCWNATLAEKVKILDHFRNHGGRQVETLKVFQHEMPRLSKSLLSRWVTNENEIRMQFEAASASDVSSTVKRARRIAPLLLMDKDRSETEDEDDYDDDSPKKVSVKRRLQSGAPSSSAKRSRQQMTKPAGKNQGPPVTRESLSKALVLVNPNPNEPIEDDEEDQTVDIEGDDPEEDAPSDALKKASEGGTREGHAHGQTEPTWDEVHGALSLLRRHCDAQGAKLPVQVHRDLESVNQYLEKMHRQGLENTGGEPIEGEGEEETKGGRRGPFFPESLHMNGNGVDVLAMAGEAMAGHGLARDSAEESDEEQEENVPRPRGRPRKYDATNGAAKKGKGKRSGAGKAGRKTERSVKVGEDVKEEEEEGEDVDVDVVEDEEEKAEDAEDKSKSKGRRS